MTERLRVVIADDDKDVAEQWMANYLTRHPDIEVVAVCSNERDVVKAIRVHKAHALLVDMIWDRDIHAGDRLIASASHANPAIAIVAYSSHWELIPAKGAHYSVTKPFTSDKMADAIRNAYHIAQQDQKGYMGEPLRPHEIDIVRLIVKGKTDQEIALALGYAGNTVRGYVKEIISKMYARNRTNVAAIAIKFGIVNLEED